MVLTPKEISSVLDHSMLQPFLKPKDIEEGCKLALNYKTAAVCARPCDIPILASMLDNTDINICTVIGFPHGAHTSATKIFEANEALEKGCNELDMVLNIGWLIDGQYSRVEDEIKKISALCHQNGAILKVILETCYLTDEQKISACKISEVAEADFVKTSTGYGTGGATVKDLILMRKTVSSKVKIKASGGLRDLDAVLSAMAVGAERCGVSATSTIMKEALRRYKEGKLLPINTPKEMGIGY